LQEKAFASTAGTYCTQRCYRTEGEYVGSVELEKTHHKAGFALFCLSAATMGWELYAAERIPRVREHSIGEELQRVVEEAEADAALPIKPVDVGRYDTVLDALSMARLL